MDTSPKRQRGIAVSPRWRFGLLWLVLLLVGCGEPAPITEYTIDKDPQTQKASPPKESQQPAQRPGLPTYDVPPGWEKSSNKPLSLDTYVVAKDGQETFFTLIPLTLLTDDLIPANVDRWRGQVSLPPLPPEDSVKLAQTLNVAGAKVRYFKIASDDPKPGDQAMLVACFDHAGKTWYFKLFGDAGITVDEEQNFQTFIQSVRFPQN